MVVYRRLRRASTFFALAVLATVAPVLGDAAAVPLVALAGLLLFGIEDGPLFRTLAVQGDHEEERLYGLGAFALALAGLAAAATLPRVPLATEALAAGTLAVGGGRLGRALVRSWAETSPRPTEPPEATNLVSDGTGGTPLNHGDRIDSGAINTRAVDPASMDPTLIGERLLPAVGYLLAGGLTAAVGHLFAGVVTRGEPPTGAAVDAAGSVATAVPPAAVGAAIVVGAISVLTAVVVRSLVYARDAHLTVVVVAFVAWGLTAMGVTPSPLGALAAVVVTAGLGAAAYALGAASVSGMVAGAFVLLLTLVLGGVGWFLALTTFYGLGGLVSKYRFDEKAARGVAQENAGARGTGNVAANSAVALVSVVGFAATAGDGGSLSAAFALAFAGAVATAMADTLSSEVGGLFDRPRLVTTLRPVPAGTDGAVTWQGELAGFTGAALVGLVVTAQTPVWGAVVGTVAPVDPAATLVVTLAGVGGMTVDSLLGAAVEGNRVGNETVNFLATLSGAVVAVALGFGVGLGL
jgi:uncharacterized protein (TIGR00297 family)